MTTSNEQQEKGDTTEALEISAIVAGGDGLARRSDGCVVFVPRTVPGERVTVTYTQQRKQWSRARVNELLESAPSRREPPCRYYGACGGCQLQHMTYAAQLEAKSALIADSLRRLGGIEIAPPEVVASPKEFEYRNRLALTLRPQRDRVQAGLHALDEPAEIVEIEDCPLAEGPVNAAWSGILSVWGQHARKLPSGEELRLTLRANAGGQAGLAIEGATDPGEPERLLAAVDGLVAVWVLDRKGKMMMRAGERTLDEEWGKHRVPIAGTAFVQVNREVASQMDAWVREQLGEIAGKRIVDAYCGFGLRALEMAQGGASVLGIELDRHSVNAARKLAADAGSTARFMATGVERALAKELPADRVILNPPRTGVMKPVVSALRSQPPERLIYVSCDPATLARDLGALAEEFELEACRAFDLFPQTASVETVATLRRRS